MEAYLCRKTDLTVVESPFDSDVVNIRIGDRGHLSLLNRRDTTFWMEDENRNIFLVSEAVNRRTENVSSKRFIEMN
jgi:hypothetical protein